MGADRQLLTEKIGITDATLSAGKRLIGLVLSQWKIVALGLLCEVLSTLLISAAPIILKKFIDNALIALNIKYLTLFSIILVVLYGVRWFFAYFSSYFVTLSGLNIVEKIRNVCYRSFQDMSYGYFEKNRVGEMMSRLTNDTAVIQNFITSSIAEMVRVPIAVIVGLCVVVYLSAKLTLIAIVILPLIALIITVMGRRMKKISVIVQEKFAALNVIMQEVLSSMHVVKAFSMEDHECKRFATGNHESLAASLRQVKLRAYYNPMVEFLGAMGLSIILWIGGNDIINKTPDFITGKPITVGSILALFFGLQQVFTQINRINTLNLSLQHAFAASDRVFEIIDMEPDVKESDTAITIPEIKGNIEFTNVSFAYNPGEPILNDINLTVTPGMVVALVGGSGSGKSTLVKLLSRFYDVNSGAITIEGIDIREATFASYRPHIGIVPQDTVLFCTSIRDNIAYGKLSATEDEIISAARAAYAHDFIMEMPNGYDTLVGERGYTLSGGQRQRIAIARAILKDPRILILDEATSNVDNVSEVYIQKALELLMQSRTTFVIAHRLSTIQNADIILVLDNGRIVERGRHEVLYAAGGAYTRLYELTMKHPGTDPSIA